VNLLEGMKFHRKILPICKLEVGETCEGYFHALFKIPNEKG
jgi:hypothetical protein